MDEWERYHGVSHAPQGRTVRKLRALELLELDKMNDEQMLELRVLTAFQSRWRAEHENYRKELWELIKKGDMDIARTRLFGTPSYELNVDACLKLPLPAYHCIHMRSTIKEYDPPDNWMVRIESGLPAEPLKSVKTATGGTLPITILKCWWAIQD